MKFTMNKIIKRYSTLAETNENLSCGKAIEFTPIKQGDICLDLGCGIGANTKHMASKTGKMGYSIGIDITDIMLKKASKSIDKNTNYAFIHSDIENIPLKNESVDVVISNCTFNHCIHKQSLWNEVYRILKPMTMVIVSDIYSHEVIPDEYHLNPDAIAECWAGAITKNKNLEIIRQAGFKKIDILEESRSYKKGNTLLSSWTIRALKE